MSGLRLSTHDDPARDAPAAVRAVDDGIDGYNGQEPGLADVRPLAVFAHDAAGAVVGGAVGRCWGTAAELQQLWVTAPARRGGIGRTLMARFEAEAAARGVTLVYLETFSFQAPAFYERLGYRTVLQVAGYTRGITRHTMHKTLAAELATPA